MPRFSTYRIRYRITGWLEVEACSEDDALDKASDKDAVELIEDTVGPCLWDFDEVEANP